MSKFKEGRRKRMSNEKNDWSDIRFAYNIGDIVYVVNNPGANVDTELEPIISDWIIDGVRIDKDRHPVYHLTVLPDAPLERKLWSCGGIVKCEEQLFPDFQSARQKKAEMWEENIAAVEEKKRKKLKAWKDSWK